MIITINPLVVVVWPVKLLTTLDFVAIATKTLISIVKARL